MGEMKFKVGDRVICYAGSRKKAEVTAVNRPAPYAGPIEVTYRDSQGRKAREFVHEKQLRRLVKRESLRLWVNVIRANTDAPASGYNPKFDFSSVVVSSKPQPGAMEFVEVRRRNDTKPDLGEG